MASHSGDVQSSSCENPGATALEVYSTDDESTGQRCSATREKQHQNLEKMISKHKSDSMFELRKLSLHQRPVSSFVSKHTLEECFANRAPHRDNNESSSSAESAGEPQGESSSAESAGGESSSAEYAGEPLQEGSNVQSTGESQASFGEPQEVPLLGSVNGQPEASQSEAVEEPAPQSLRPEHIHNDMQALQELRVVRGILQGPIHEQIDRALQEVLTQQRLPGHQRPRPRPRPRPAQAEVDESEGGDEMNQAPVGRLLAAGRRQRGSRGRRVRFRSQIPTPNPDGRYPVPQRDQSAIVERLRQSPTLNSLGEEARDEIVAEVGSLVSQQLVTSALAGDFRGILELHVQNRAEQINRGNVRPPMGQPHYPRAQQYFEDEREATPSAGVRELREEMMIMKGQLNELKQMMRVSFDLQLDIQRAIRQEVSAALTAFIASPQSGPAAATGGGHQAAQAICQIPTLAEGNTLRGARSGARVKVADSGHCVICSDGTIDCVIYHCGHMCTCMACGLEMKSKALKCPICRAPITDVIRAYTSML